MVGVPLAYPPEGVDLDAWMAACDSVRAYCGWHVAPVVTETVTVDGPGGSMLFLPTLHLVDLVSITNDGTAVSEPEWSATGMVRGSWSSKFRSIVAEMEHGLESCPLEIVGVLTDMAAAAGRGGVSSVTSGAHQVQFEPASPDSRQRTVLDLYRLVSVA